MKKYLFLFLILLATPASAGFESVIQYYNAAGGGCVADSTVVGTDSEGTAQLALAEGVIVWNKFTASQSCTVDTMSRYVIDGSSAPGAIAIYADNGSGTAPSGTPIANTGTESPPDSTNAWNETALSSAVAITSSTVYWIALWGGTDSGSDGFRTAKAVTGGTHCYAAGQGDIGTWPNASEATCEGGTELYSVKALAQ